MWWAGERDLAVNTRLMSGDDLRGCLREKREREKGKEKRKEKVLSSDPVGAPRGDLPISNLTTSFWQKPTNNCACTGG